MDWVPIQTAILESQFLSLDLSFPICKMETGEGVLQLLTIAAIEITSASEHCKPSPVLSVLDAGGLALRPGS